MLVRLAAPLVLVAGCILTAAVASKSVTDGRAFSQFRFERLVSLAEAETKDRLGDYEKLLRAGRAFTFSDPNFSPTEARWRGLADSLKITTNAPDFRSIGFVSRVLRNQKEAFERGKRDEFGAFDISPPGERDEYWVLTYVDPAPKATINTGMDLAEDSRRRVALERARDTGEPSLTGSMATAVPRPTLFGQPVLICYVAVYRGGRIPTDIAQRRAALNGWIALVFTPDTLMRDIDVAYPELDIDLFDVTDPAGATMLHDSPNDARDLGTSLDKAVGAFNTKMPFSFGGRNFVLRAHATQHFEAEESQVRHAATVICTGLFVTMLLAWAVRMIAGRREDALALARLMTSALRESEARYRGMVESQVDMIMRGDMTGTLTYVNDTVCNRLNRPRAALIGAEWSTLVLLGDLPAATIAIQNLLEGVTSRAIYDCRILTRDGPRWYAWESDAVKDEHGATTEIQWVGRDITARKHAEERLKILSRTVEQSPVSVVITDPDGVIEYVNPKFVELTGYATSEVYGKSARLLQSGLTPPEVYVALWTNIRSGKKWEGLLQNRKKNGELHWEKVLISSIRAQDGTASHYVAVKEDITELKQMEEAVLAKQQAEAASRAKSAFLSMMSHELRSPTAGILGATSLLAGTSLDERQKKYTRIIQISAQALLSILDDVLDVVKLEAGKITIQPAPFDVTVAITDVINLFAAQAEDKNIHLAVRFDASVPRTLHGDAARIRQIVVNLIANGVKFTKVGGVSVDVSYDRGDELLRVVVTDTGIGIRADVQPHLFTRFTQADSSISRNYGGTGLGLAISKQLCELMGGQIGLESTPGIGSTFWFTIHCGLGDAALAGAAEPSLEASDAPDSERLHILLAEDSLVHQTIATTVLRQAGHIVEVAANGLEAVNAVQRTRFDLILMDIEMPEMDGVRATQAIRKLAPPLSAVPVIALTAHAMVEHREKYLAAGMDDYISKPFTPEALMTAIARTRLPEEARQPVALDATSDPKAMKQPT